MRPFSEALHEAKADADAELPIQRAFERRIPFALIDVDRKDGDAMPLRVVDEGRRVVETHRPSVEEGAAERLMMVPFEIGRDISEDGEACRVALGEAVLTKAADLREYLLSEFGCDAVLYHPREEALAVGFDPAVSSKGGHIAAQLVGLARRIIRDLDGELHHLLLKDRDAERALQDLFEARMSINDGPFSVATP